jgi:hypothetical protein
MLTYFCGHDDGAHAIVKLQRSLRLGRNIERISPTIEAGRGGGSPIAR